MADNIVDISKVAPTIAYTPGVKIEDQLDPNVWSKNRIDTAKQSLNTAMGIGSNMLFPPTEQQKQAGLEFWFQTQGRFMPRYVLDEIGIAGSVPTVQESIGLEATQKIGVVKDFLGIERKPTKDPLEHLLVDTGIADPSDIDPTEQEAKLAPEMEDIIKAASLEDLDVIKQTMIENPMEFEEGLSKAVDDEIKVKELIPNIIAQMADTPLTILTGTQFFNAIGFGLPEFTSRKGFSPTEALLGLPKGTESTFIKAVARVREQVVAQDPTLLAQIGGEAGQIAADVIKFAALPDPSKLKVFARLSPAVKSAIGVGTKAGLVEALQAPKVGETAGERLMDVGAATGIGALTGIVFSKVTEFIKNIPLNQQAAKLAAKFPQGTKAEWAEALKLQQEGKLISVKVKARIGAEKALPRKVVPKGFRRGFADIEKPAKLAIRATKVVAKAAAKTKEGIAIEAAKKILAVKVQPSKAVKPTKIITKAESASLKEIGVLGEGEKLTIVANPQLKKAIQSRENEIATLKTRRNELKAEKQFVQAKTKAEEIAKKETALAEVKANAEIKLETTIEGSKEKIAKIKSATEFKEELRNDAISMVTNIEGGIRKDFINRANKVKTVKALQKLTKEVEHGIEKFEKKVAIKDLEGTISDVKSAVESLPSPQREKLEAALDAVSTKKISKKALDPDDIVRDPDDLDVKARRGRVQLLGKDLESLQKTTQRLASELAGQLETLDPDIEEALRLPNERVRQLNLLTSKNANEISVEDINFINESLKSTLHEGKLKGKLLTKKGLKPLEGVLEKAPTEVRPTRKIVKADAGKVIDPKKSALEKAIGGTNKFVRLDELHADTLVELITNADSSATTKILDLDPHAGLRETAETFNAWKQVTIEEFGKAGFTDLDQILDEHTVTLAGKKIKLTTSELMSLEMDTRSPDNLLQRLDAEGIQIGDREPIVYAKNASGEDIVDRLQEINDAVAIVRNNKKAMALLDFTERMNLVQRETVNEMSKLRFGYDIARDENYYPRSRVGDDKVSGPKGKISIPPEKIGRYQARTGGTKPLRLKPWHEVFLGGLETDAAFSGMTLPLRNARLLLSDKGFVDAMKAAGRQDELKNIIEIFSNAQGITSSKDIVDVFGSKIIKARTTSALGFRISTRGTQVMSFYTAQAITGNQGAFVIRPYGKAKLDVIEADSALMSLRWASRRVGVEVGTNASTEAFSSLFFDKTKSIANVGMKGLIKGDRMAIANIYYQLVTPEIMTKARSGKNVDPFKWEGDNVADLPRMDNADSPEFRYAAARRLEYVVRRSQPMFDMLDRSVSMSSTNFARRSFLMFRTALNAMDNVVNSAIIQSQKGTITATELGFKLGSVATSHLAVALWKRGLKWAIGTGWAVTLAGLGIFKFTEPADKKETLANIGKDTVRGIAGTNPVTKVLATAAEIAADKIAGNNYPWGRDPVENPVIEVINSGAAATVNVTQTFANIGLLDEFVEEVTRDDIAHNEKLAKKIAVDFTRAIKASWDFGTTITGAPIQAPVQEFIAPLFRDTDIKIIREVTFGDVDNPQEFSEGVFDLYEQRAELRKKEKTKRLSAVEDKKLDILDNFVMRMNTGADILRQTEEHRIRKARFSAVELTVKAVKSQLNAIKQLEEK